MSWLEVPGPLLAACLRRLPALRAAEQLRAAAVVGIASGTFREDVAREIRAGWIRDLGDEPPPRARPGREQIAIQAVALGIAVESAS